MDTGTTRTLTDLQAKILELDSQGMRVKDIANMLGLRPGRVANAKQRMAKLGHKVSSWHRPKESVQAEKRAILERKLRRLAALVKLERGRDSLGPARPVPARTYCRCGLTMPCNNCISIMSFVYRAGPGYVEPEAVAWHPGQLGY